MSVRTFLGAIAGPLAIALLFSLPGLGSPGYLQWTLLSCAISLALFLICAAISHLILRWKRWTKLRQYVGVMFAVATTLIAVAQFALLEWTFGNGGSEYHLMTQVVDKGHFTLGGVMLTLLEAMFSAGFLALSFAIFWTIAVRSRAGQPNGA